MVGIFPHTPGKQSFVQWMLAGGPLIQFSGGSLHRVSVGSHRLRAQSHKTAFHLRFQLKVQGCFTCSSDQPSVIWGSLNFLLGCDWFAGATHRTQENSYQVIQISMVIQVIHVYQVITKGFYKDKTEEILGKVMGKGAHSFHACSWCASLKESQRFQLYGRFFELSSFECLWRLPYVGLVV